MPSFDNNDVIVLVSIAIVLALLLIIVSLWRGNRLMRDVLKSSRTEVQPGVDREAVDQLGEKMDSVSQEISDIKGQILDKPVYEGESDAYLQAINAARAGADALELESRFGMSASEAELLVSVHGPQQSRAD
ncbi:DUF2802 domain-containing protein [Granulosicoccaceae sp. 1_MG-2023]|nr:DUF2802 domain-containing protein [Granulosicoccaceae sp. 1_MG-2023]